MMWNLRICLGQFGNNHKPENVQKSYHQRRWVHGYDLETIDQYSTKKTHQSEQHQNNTHSFFRPRRCYSPRICSKKSGGKQRSYLEVLKCLRDALQTKRLDSYESGDWVLYLESAPAHSSQLIQNFLVKNDIFQLRQSLYSCDLALCDFWLFPILEYLLEGKRFRDVEEIKQNATRHLYGNLLGIFRESRTFTFDQNRLGA